MSYTQHRIVATYTPRGSQEQKTATVMVTGRGIIGEMVFSACNLNLWGCGKDAQTISGALRALMQDMATLVSWAVEADAEEIDDKGLTWEDWKALNDE